MVECTLQNMPIRISLKQPSPCRGRQGGHRAHLIGEETETVSYLRSSSVSFVVFNFSVDEVRLGGGDCTRGSSCFISVSAKASWFLRNKELCVFQLLGDASLPPSFSFNQHMFRIPITGAGLAPFPHQPHGTER